MAFVASKLQGAVGFSKVRGVEFLLCSRKQSKQRQEVKNIVATSEKQEAALRPTRLGWSCYWITSRPVSCL